MSWRPSEDPTFISAEPSPAMFHMDVEGFYDHVVEVRNWLYCDLCHIELEGIYDHVVEVRISKVLLMEVYHGGSIYQDI